MNSCFRKQVFSINYYLDKKIEMSFKNLSTNNNNHQLLNINNNKHNDNIYLTNINLLAFVLIDWDLWQPFEFSTSTPLWLNMFEILNTLLSDFNQNSLVYHTNLFIKYKILEKLMHFVLDANEESYSFKKSSLSSLTNIFKHFNSIPSNNMNEIKELFANFFEYLHILHPENKAYIVYATNYFYYNLTLNLPSVPFSSMQEYLKSPNELTLQQPDTPKQEQKRTVQDRFQFNESLNEKCFSQFSASLMEIMHDMITILPDSMLNEIFNLLKYESFIMFTMDDNQTKRYEAFKLFLTLIERSSNLSFLITSSLATVASAAGVVANLASNPITSITNTNINKSFDQQQTWMANKENLIYAMCNQLNQFNQSDERFVEFCIQMLLNQPFSFQNPMPDSQYLKSISGQINSRVTYCYILIALLYSTRKHLQTCHNTLRFLMLLLQSDCIKIEFLISKAGLIQVLFNLLRYFSDANVNSNKEIINDLRQLFCIVTRLLLRFNENQDVDNFTFYLNSLISLTYDSSNIGYEKLNHNLKSIVLNVFQSIQNDLNSIITFQETTANSNNTNMSNIMNKSLIFKKIIMPLINTTTGGGNSQIGLAPPITTLFDSDFRFQKFIIFLVDFIYIIFDKISDTKINDTTYDINDELAIFAFTILLNSLSIGLETQSQSKTKFSSFFRQNLTLIRFQFRRLLLFMMHPNHKLLHTKFQLVKRLLNTSNCELILRFILSSTDELLQTSMNSSSDHQNTFNLKLAFYLNALINSNSSSASQISNNNDKEILKHLNEILITIGFNYKTELGTILNFDLNEISTSSSFLLVSPSSKMQSTSLNDNKLASDFLNQCDKELDEEIIKIYSRTNQMFKRFLQQFDRLTEELNDYAVTLTNQVVSMHSQFRKSYLQRFKNKRIQIFDIKQKWIHLIEKMTHEKCAWYESNETDKNESIFFILDQTEGPNRERRRIKKVNQLNIPSRFFKPDLRQKIDDYKQINQLKYLINNFDNSDTNSGFSAGDYMLYYLKNSEVLK